MSCLCKFAPLCWQRVRGQKANCVGVRKWPLTSTEAPGLLFKLFEQVSETSVPWKAERLYNLFYQKQVIKRKNILHNWLWAAPPCSVTAGCLILSRSTNKEDKMFHSKYGQGIRGFSLLIVSDSRRINMAHVKTKCSQWLPEAVTSSGMLWGIFWSISGSFVPKNLY